MSAIIMAVRGNGEEMLGRWRHYLAGRNGGIHRNSSARSISRGHARRAAVSGGGERA